MYFRIKQELKDSQEFQSSLVRMLVWFSMAGVFTSAIYYNYFELESGGLVYLFAGHFLGFLFLLFSVIKDPSPNKKRQYLSMIGDLSGTTFCIYLVGHPLSPFYLIYVLIFVSQGTRYGKNHLTASSIGSVVLFSFVQYLLSGWKDYPYEMGFLVSMLVVIPLYQHILLRRLHEATAAAENANKAKSDFLATMSHEIRTPLSGVIGMSQLLKSTEQTDEQKAFTNSILSSAEVLHHLIGDILDLSKIDANKLTLSYEPTDCREMMLKIGRVLNNQALDKGLEVIFQCDKSVPEIVNMDELRLSQVIYNLMGNAIKFTDDGYVKLSVRLVDANESLNRPHLLLEIIDTGIGIEKKKIKQIFNEFWQADDSTTKEYGGTGLGTTVATTLVKLMHGYIHVESEIGEGSCFSIGLPIKNDKPILSSLNSNGLYRKKVLVLDTSCSAFEAINQVLTDLKMDITFVKDLNELAKIRKEQIKFDLFIVADSPSALDLAGINMMLQTLVNKVVPVIYLCYLRRMQSCLENNSVVCQKPFDSREIEMHIRQVVLGEKNLIAQTQTNTLNIEVNKTQKKYHVLVAEDDDVNAQFMQSVIENAGHQLCLVRNGKQALEQLKQQSFDIALVDLRMPELDGFGLVKEWRKTEKESSRLPMVALTANAETSVEKKCLAAGMDGFLIKPLEIENIQNILDSYIT